MLRGWIRDRFSRGRRAPVEQCAPDVLTRVVRVETSMLVLHAANEQRGRRLGVDVGASMLPLAGDDAVRTAGSFKLCGVQQPVPAVNSSDHDKLPSEIAHFTARGITP